MPICAHDEQIGIDDVAGMRHYPIPDRAVTNFDAVHYVIHFVGGEIFLQVSRNACRLDPLFPEHGHDMHFLGPRQDRHGVGHCPRRFAAIVPSDHHPV